MPIINDRRKSLLQFCTSKRLVSDVNILDRQFEDSLRPEWSDLYFQNIRYFNTNLNERNRLATHFKEYSWAEAKPLVRNLEGFQDSLVNALKERTSNKKLSSFNCRFEEVSNILSFAYSQKENSAKRLNPSGGQRYPLEIYIYAHQIDTLERGIYHYNPQKNELEKLPSSINDRFLNELYLDEAEILKKSGFIVFMTAIASRSTIKYGSFGYRLIYLEAGHLSQSMWLLATAQNLKCWPLSALREKRLYEALNINPHQEFFVQSMAFGK